jgi:hypothetical protein
VGEQMKKGSKRSSTGKTVIIIIAVLLIIGSATGAALLKASQKPSFCTSCHNMKPYYTSWASSDLLANKHEKAGVTCHDCHKESLSAQMSEGVKYVTGDYKTPMKKRNFGTREMCFECHSDKGNGAPKGDTFETVTSKTAFEEENPHSNHNGDMECNECHSMHRQSKVMCAQCHQFNWFEKLDSSWVNN